MAVFCLAARLDDLEARLSRMIVAYTRAKAPVTAARSQGGRRDDRAAARRRCSPISCRRWRAIRRWSMAGRSPISRMAAIRSSRRAPALKLADYVVTEAGFRRRSRRGEVLRHQVPAGRPQTGRLRRRRDRARAQDSTAASPRRRSAPKISPRWRRASPISNATSPMSQNSACRSSWRSIGFDSDTPAEHDLISATVREKCGVEAVVCDHWAHGGEGAEALARRVVALADRGAARVSAAL